MWWLVKIVNFSFHVCMYVCMCVFIYVCVCVCVCVLHIDLTLCPPTDEQHKIASIIINSYNSIYNK